MSIQASKKNLKLKIQIQTSKKLKLKRKRLIKTENTFFLSFWQVLALKEKENQK